MPASVRPARLAVAAVGGCLALGLLAGCVPEPAPEVSSDASDAPSASPSPTPSELPDRAPDGILGQGTLVGSGSGAGSASEVARIRVEEVSSSAADIVVDGALPTGVELVMVPQSQRGTDCVVGPYARIGATSGAAASPAPSASPGGTTGAASGVELPPGWPAEVPAVEGDRVVLPLTGAFGDPTMWAGLALVEPVRAGQECAEVEASAELTWNVRPFRPRLAELVDGGARPGADGDLATSGDTLLSYRIAPGDSLIAIGERFDVDQTDLRYLNPFREWDGEATIYVDEVLNLSLAHR